MSQTAGPYTIVTSGTNVATDVQTTRQTNDVGLYLIKPLPPGESPQQIFGRVSSPVNLRRVVQFKLRLEY